ncbi:MAG: hypothetical protein CBD97_01965 [Pelagibacteraceae bacterium TMED237]|nr:MAG: hypothetical protein CBD97_01965 [Pelagibacteraceae bacterium TMED237]|tara:strand:+ start:1083 stop:1931 length:849 start_codon:yes stop_codon:yes gene_type:complete
MSTTAISNINSTVLNFLEKNNLSNNELTKLWMDNNIQNELKVSLTTKKNVATSKRQPSAYLLFCADNRQKVKEFLLKEQKDIKSFEITQKLGLMWKSIKEDPSKQEELKKYQDLANANKFSVEDKPKRGKSSYLYFCNDFREIVKKDLIKEFNTEPKATLITKELGKRWNKLKEEGKISKYEDMANLDKQRYYDEKSKKISDQEVLVSKKETKEETKEVTKEVSKETTKKTKKDNKLTGYQNFCEQRRASLKKENPSKKPIEITKMLAVEWKNLNSTEQMKY